MKEAVYQKTGTLINCVWGTRLSHFFHYGGRGSGMPPIIKKIEKKVYRKKKFNTLDFEQAEFQFFFMFFQKFFIIMSYK